MNVPPPGQSGFCSASGADNPRFDDQTTLFNARAHEP